MENRERKGHRVLHAARRGRQAGRPIMDSGLVYNTKYKVRGVTERTHIDLYNNCIRQRVHKRDGHGRTLKLLKKSVSETETISEDL